MRLRSNKGSTSEYKGAYMPRKQDKRKPSVRLKNPATGEVKFVEPYSEYYNTLVSYGWVKASYVDAIDHYQRIGKLSKDA